MRFTSSSASRFSPAIPRFTLAIALSVAVGASSADAQTAFTGTYTFTSTSGTANPFAYNGSAIPNLTVGGLTRSSGVSMSSSSGNFRASNWPTASSQDPNKYFEFTLTPDPSYTLAMSSITFGIGNSNTGPKRWEWRSSLDNYAAPITTYSATASGLTISGGVISSGSNSSWAGTVLNLSGGGFNNFSSAVTFRMYAYLAGGTAGTGGFQTSMSFAGTLSAPLSGTFTWSGNGSTAGGNGTWSASGANWSSTGAAPFASAWNDSSQASFGTSGGTVTIDAAGVTASRAIEFAVDGYTLTGGTLTFGGSSSAMTVASAATAAINAPLAGANGLTKFGAGTLSLGGVNQFTGLVTVSAGTLQIAADSALGNVANDVTLASALKTTASLTLGSGRDMTGSGTLDIAPGTTLTSSGSFNLTSTTLSNGGTLSLQGSTRAVGTLTFATAATVNGSGALSVGGITATSVTSGSAIVTPAITFSSSGDKTVDVGSGGALVLAGDVAGTTGRIAKTGAGALVVSGSNTTSGFRLGAAGATPTIGGTLVINAAAASGTAQLQFNYGTLKTDVSGGLTFANGLSIGGRSGAVAILGGAEPLTFTGSNSFYRAPGTSGELRLDVNNVTTLSGLFGTSSGSGSVTGITIGGTGRLNLTGNATALVESVTLQDTVQFLVEGSLGSTGVLVGAGNAIGGDGSIAGNLTLGAGAKFLFDATKTLTVSGSSVTFGSFGIGDLLGFSAAVPDGEYFLIDGPAVVSTANLSNLGIANAADLGGGRKAYFEVGSLKVVVVPEPSPISIVIAGIAASGALRFLRRRCPSAGC